MKYKDTTARILKHGYRFVFKPKFENPSCIFDRKLANEKIYELLLNDTPCMISRLGSIELGCILNYIAINSKKNKLKKLFEYVTDDVGTPWWDDQFLFSLNNNAGVFPSTYETLEKFSQIYLNDILYIDLLGSFHYGEKFLPLKKEIVNVHLEALYPFWVNNPWTKVLTGKKVLIVHPFTNTIEKQYSKRRLLFETDDVLPDFELKTLTAVQSNCGNEVPFESWFDALKYMKDQIEKIDFDFCILGCGAYGLPLAAHVKRMGKKSIHLGGGTQLLFGIMGKRWDKNYQWDNLSGNINTNYWELYNKAWTRASKLETPEGAEKVEGACYW
jgi:hypothetical protein